jgi:hypothetical protein
MTRKVVNPAGLRLPTGEFLPYGTSICFTHPFYPEFPPPTHEETIHTSPSQPPLTEFHPFRYSKLRENTPGQEHKHQFVTTGPDSIAFGHGKLACPGRFYASNLIKVVVLELLQRYDLGLGPRGEGQADGVKRPGTLKRGTVFTPDPRAQIFLRDR